MSAYATLLGAVAPIFIMLAIGWAMRRSGALSADADSSILRLGINVFYPALIADTILGNSALQRIENVLVPAAAGAATVLIGFGIALIGARTLGLERPHPARTFAFSVGLQNYGFIAIPLVQTLYGRGALGVQFTFTLGVELALWSAGIWLLSGHRGTASWRDMVTAPVIAIIVSTGINYFVGDQWLPQFGRVAMQSLGACSIPSQVVLTGAVLADVMRRAAPGPWLRPVIVGNLLRITIIPALILLLGGLLSPSVELRHVLIVQAAMPSAMVPIVLVKHYGGETNLAAWIVSASTALGIVSIPFWLRIGPWWLGN
ncbi:MAG: AEC family transporter [Chthoniobacteraceae bacterium]